MHNFSAEGEVSRRFSFFIRLVLVLWVGGAYAGAQGVAGADWFERSLGEGVVWRHYLFEDLGGNPQAVSYVEADLSNPQVSVQFPFLEAARQRPSGMIPEQVPQAKAGINGTYFVTAAGGPGGHTTYLRVNGAEILPGGSLFAAFGREGALALTGSGAASIIKRPAGGWNTNTVHPNLMACGPIVLFDGVVPGAYLRTLGDHSTARHPRSAVGLTPYNRLILLAVDGRTAMSAGMSCEELGELMQALGCDYGLNLDGGGSTTLWGAGEPFAGVLNYPCDNGLFDHLGERVVSNAISVSSAQAAPRQWDGRLTSKIYSAHMGNGAAQTVQLRYQNIGTATWTAADTTVVVARPTTRTSVLQADSWISAQQPAVMVPAVVAPGETATFTFTLQAPVLTQSAGFLEHFMLTQKSVGRIGPADSEAWMYVAIQLPAAPYADFIVESRPGGQNSAWYSDSGMADTSLDCRAPGLSLDLGSRYGSTYRSVAGAKWAKAAPDFPADGFYNVYVAWPDGGLRRDPITYKVQVPGATDTMLINQTSTANEWVRLGTRPYFFHEGSGGAVVQSNEDVDVSGNMYAGAVKFEYVPVPDPVKSYRVNYLEAGAARPTIDGVVSAGEWTAAAPAASGFVSHDNPAKAATEDASFRMLYDDERLYIQWTMQNEFLPAYAAPPTGYGYGYLTGDKINFYLTPGGVNRQNFYRVTLSPNPTNGQCYVWSQANLTKTTSADAGTDWAQRGGAAYTYQAGVLTVEYSIEWAKFNRAGMAHAGAPAHGDIWGVQPALSNNLGGGKSESVNWEPDGTPSFVLGEPFGRLEFTRAASAVEDWVLY